MDVCTTVWCRCSVCDRGVLCSWMSAQLFGAGALYVIVEYCAQCSWMSAQLFGAGALCVIVEYCAHGCLHNCLVQVLCV